MESFSWQDESRYRSLENELVKALELNRVYTELEATSSMPQYPAKPLENICAELRTTVSANATLERYHRARKGTRELPFSS